MTERVAIAGVGLPGRRWLALGVAAAWPTAFHWVWDALDPITALEAHISAVGAVPLTEAPVVASQLMFFPDSALCFLPGLVALRWTGGWRSSAPATTANRTLAWTLGVGATTLVAGLLLHLTVDLPTGDLGPAEVVAKVRPCTRIVDTALYAVFPALFEESYFRGRLFSAMSSTWTARATITATTLAFAACHPADLVPFAVVWGALAGLVRQRLGSFWPMVAAHAAWNAIAYADAWLLLG